MSAISPVTLQVDSIILSSGTASQAVELNGSKVLTTVAITGTGSYVKSASPTFTGTAGFAAIAASGTVTAQGLIDASGASAGQIKFPATQNASANANTLDDYAEGTWTPTDASGLGATFTNVTGNCFYTKIGNMIFATFKLTYPTTADATNALIGGLPVAVLNGTANTWGGFLSFTDSATALVVDIGGSTTTSFRIRAAAGGATQTNANLSGKTIQGVLVYRSA